MAWLHCIALKCMAGEVGRATDTRLCLPLRSDPIPFDPSACRCPPPHSLCASATLIAPDRPCGGVTAEQAAQTVECGRIADKKSARVWPKETLRMVAKSRACASRCMERYMNTRTGRKAIEGHIQCHTRAAKCDAQRERRASEEKGKKQRKVNRRQPAPAAADCLFGRWEGSVCRFTRRASLAVPARSWWRSRRSPRPRPHRPFRRPSRRPHLPPPRRHRPRRRRRCSAR